MPMPRRWSSVAGVVMLFHSPMSRMNSTLPDAVDGESEPNTATWRRYHGHDGHGEQRHGAGGGRQRDARRARGLVTGSAPRTPAVPQEDGAQHRQDQHAVVARERRQPGEEARQGEVAGAPRSPRPAIHREAATSGWYSEKLSGWAMYTNDSAGQGDEHAGRRGHEPRGPRVPRDRPGERSGERADDRERQRGRHRRRSEQPDERHLDQRRERHPVGVGRDRQDRDRRDPAADLREDPDDVHAEARGRPPAVVRRPRSRRNPGTRGPGTCAATTSRATRASRNRAIGVRTAGAA